MVHGGGHTGVHGLAGGLIITNEHTLRIVLLHTIEEATILGNNTYRIKAVSGGDCIP